MRNPITFVQAPDSIRLDSRETIENPPSFEEVTQEIAVIILVNLVLALAAELLTRGADSGLPEPNPIRSFESTRHVASQFQDESAR